jgi:hypothetical protein
MNKGRMWVSKYLIPSSGDSAAKRRRASELQTANVAKAAKRIAIRRHVKKPVQPPANADSARTRELQLASKRMQCRV